MQGQPPRLSAKRRESTKRVEQAFQACVKAHNE
jgi:hypothetical protein